MYKKILILVAVFCFLSSYIYSAERPSSTSLTSLALSNIYSYSSGSYLVIRVTGMGQVAATLTAGFRYTFDFGSIYLGAGSVPGNTIDFSREDWFDSLVWQAELNINLSKVGDWLAKQMSIVGSDNSNNNNTSKTK